MEVQPCGNNVMWKECLVCFESGKKNLDVSFTIFTYYNSELLFVSFGNFIYEFCQHNEVIENKT